MTRKKRTVKRAKKTTVRKNKLKNIFGSNSPQRNIKLIVNNLLLFVALSLVSFVLSKLLIPEFLKNLFYVMAMVFGFVSVAFLIIFLVLIIIKFVSRKK
jgi:hypothetical protein